MAIFGNRKKVGLHLAISSPIARAALTLGELSATRETPIASLPSTYDDIPKRPMTSDGSPKETRALPGHLSLRPTDSTMHRALVRSTSHTHLPSKKICSPNNSPTRYVDDAPQPSSDIGALDVEQQEDLFLHNIISDKFNSIITLIDGERLNDHDIDLGLPQNLALWQIQEPAYTNQNPPESDHPKITKSSINFTLQFSSGNYFSKVYLYVNSRLPPHLPPIKLYACLINTVFDIY